jgi:hypothetical protein
MDEYVKISIDVLYKFVWINIIVFSKRKTYIYQCNTNTFSNTGFSNILHAESVTVYHCLILALGFDIKELAILTLTMLLRGRSCKRCYWINCRLLERREPGLHSGDSANSNGEEGCENRTRPAGSIGWTENRTCIRSESNAKSFRTRTGY